MINMGKRPRGRGGAGSEDGFPALTRPAPKIWKLLTMFVLFAALLVMGCALKPAAPAVKNAASPAAASGAAVEPVRNILIGLSALGMMAMGAAMTRLIGGCLPKNPCEGSRIDSGFFRRLSDRPPLGRAAGRRGGEA